MLALLVINTILLLVLFGMVRKIQRDVDTSKLTVRLRKSNDQLQEAIKPKQEN